MRSYTMKQSLLMSLMLADQGIVEEKEKKVVLVVEEKVEEEKNVVEEEPKEVIAESNDIPTPLEETQ